MKLYNTNERISMFTDYLEETLGLILHYEGELDVDALPLFLRHAASYKLYTYDGARFIAAIFKDERPLPELKRVTAQTARKTNLPVGIVSRRLDARQRKALTEQRIPFICPNRAAYLPFLFYAAISGAEKQSLRMSMSPAAQAIFVALAANPGLEKIADIRTVTKASASYVTRGADELTQLGIVSKEKNGREVILKRAKQGSEFTTIAAPYLSSPVKKIIFARRNERLAQLPDAGETALSARTMLSAPPIVQKATTAELLKASELNQVLPGELDNSQTVEIQVWKYDPLIAGKKTVDNVSLMLSFDGNIDERIQGEIENILGDENA